MDNITVRGAPADLPIGGMHKAGDWSEMQLVSHNDNVTVTILICMGIITIIDAEKQSKFVKFCFRRTQFRFSRLLCGGIHEKLSKDVWISGVDYIYLL
jgi:hypothetical protein